MARSRPTWFLRKAAASSLETRLICHVDRFGDAFWFATPRTPPLWQRRFFLVNCFMLRRLLTSVRSGVVKTFRCADEKNMGKKNVEPFHDEKTHDWEQS